MSNLKLKDLIKAVRSCKTLAEERQIILNESSLIRTSIKEDDNYNRYNNISKLLYINILGYPTYYGQLECLKLISSSNFTDKRMGYLALTILLNEEAEILTLVTNSIKLDLNNFSNPYVQNLALISIGTILSKDMANDLIIDITKFLTVNPTSTFTITSPSYFSSTPSSSFSSSFNLKKKACLVLIKLIQKDPTCIDGMENILNNLIKENSNGVKVCLIQLLNVLFSISSEKTSLFHETTLFVIKLSRLLTNSIKECSNNSTYLNSSTSNLSYDPYLLVYCLNYLTNYIKYSNNNLLEEISDLFLYVITTIATTLSLNTSTSSSNAVLYECIRGIIAIDSEHSLKMLAINLLNKFLTNKDNNLRYISLNILLSVAVYDKNIIQKNRLTIIECLQDPDNSIRKRAIELLYQIVNENNLQSIVSELIIFLKTNFLTKTNYNLNPNLTNSSVILSAPTAVTTVSSSSNEINIQNIANNIINMIDKHGHKLSIKWKIDSIINILTSNVNLSDENISRLSIHFLSQVNDFYLPYIVHRLYNVMKDRTSYMPLIQTGIWCIGEYGHLLLNSYTFQDNSSTNGGNQKGESISSSTSNNNSFTSVSSPNSTSNTIHFNSVNENDIINFLEKCIKLPYLDFTTKGIILNALIKLSIRFNSAFTKSIEKILKIYEKSMSLELHQRSNEYISLINNVSNETRLEILERMPISNNTNKINISTSTSSSISIPNNDFLFESSTSDISNQVFDDLVLTFSSSSSASSIATTSSEVTTSVNLLDLSLIDTPTSTTNFITPSTSYDIYELLSLGSTISSLTVSTPNDSINSGKTLNSSSSFTSSTVTLSTGSSYPTISSGGSTPNQLTYDLLNINDTIESSNVSSSSTTSTIYSASTAFDQANNTNNDLSFLNSPSSNSLNNLSSPQGTNNKVSYPHSLAFPSSASSTFNSFSPISSSSSSSPSSSPFYFSSNPSTAKISSKIYKSNSIQVDMDYDKIDSKNPSITRIVFYFSNFLNKTLESFVFQVAVPKYLTLEIFPSSSQLLPPLTSKSVHQEIRLTNSKQGTKKIILKLKITYKEDGELKEELFQVNSFPTTY